MTKAKDLDNQLDSGTDITEHLNQAQDRHPNMASEHIDIELPSWLIDAIDQEAQKQGVSRQTLIEFWLTQRLL